MPADGMDRFEPRRPEPFGRIFLPGPTEVRPEVLEAQARAMIGHRGAEFRALMRELQAGLRALFHTERPVLVAGSSATGLMEAAVRNGVRRRLLCLVNGAFSERFRKIAGACGSEADAVEVAWGEAHDPGAVEERLRDGPGYDAVSVVHSETSTGALNPVAEIADVVGRFDDVHLLVDSVSGLGGAPLHTDRWGLDLVLTGSQKALALPPGLSFAVASRRLLERAEGIAGRGLYFDLPAFYRYLDREQTPTTPPVSLLYALRAQLDRVRAEGVEARWERHRRMAALTWEWVDRMRGERGVEVRVLADLPHRSPTVTCIRLPEGTSGPGVARRLAERGFIIGSGYGKLKETTIRIGHMGEHTPEEVETLLEALEEVLLR